MCIVVAHDRAQKIAKQHGWTVAPDAERWRRVVASPQPLRIVEQDKDFMAAMLGIAVGADRLLVLTDVSAVMTDFGTPNAASLKNVSLAELAGMSFPAWSMAPKIEGCRRFVAATGHRAAIGSLTDAVALLAGTAGTTITPTGAIAHDPIAGTAHDPGPRMTTSRTSA